MKSLKKIFICTVSAALIILASCSKSPIDKRLDEADAFMTEMETVVDRYQNKEISISEATKEFADISERVANAGEDLKFNLDELNSRQKKRYFELAKRLEKLDKDF